jgi:hypothetical protein
MGMPCSIVDNRAHASQTAASASDTRWHAMTTEFSQHDELLPRPPGTAVAAAAVVVVPLLHLQIQLARLFYGWATSIQGKLTTKRKRNEDHQSGSHASRTHVRQEQALYERLRLLTDVRMHENDDSDMRTTIDQRPHVEEAHEDKGKDDDNDDNDDDSDDDEHHLIRAMATAALVGMTSKSVDMNVLWHSHVFAPMQGWYTYLYDHGYLPSGMFVQDETDRRIDHGGTHHGHEDKDMKEDDADEEEEEEEDGGGGGGGGGHEEEEEEEENA